MKGRISNDNLLKELPAPPKEKNGWPWTEEADSSIYSHLNSLPKISILTPSYNQGQYIEQTIRSVLLQNYPNLEYIIIDGGSTDNTIDILKKYETWITFWTSQTDRGQTHAINKGMAKCNGEIFHWINSDDYYDKSCFKVLTENFDSKDTYVVAGNYRFFYDNGESKEKTIDFKLRSSLQETLAFSAINQPSTFFRLDKLRNLGELDEELQYVMDQDIWKKYLFKYGQDNIKIVNQNLTHFRFHSKSKTFRFHFNSEYFSIFYSIASKAKMDKHLVLMEKLYGKAINRNYNFKYSFSENDITLARKMINTFILVKARNAFTSKNYDLLRLCLSTLDKKWLNDYQQKVLFRIKIKLKIIKFKLTPVLDLLGKSVNSKQDQLQDKILNSQS